MSSERSAGSGDSQSETLDDDSDGDSAVRLEAADFDVPVGWFYLGERHDVPKGACYVGRYKNRYAWVDAHGIDGLAQFTLAVLTITKSSAGEGRRSAGLMVTP